MKSKVLGILTVLGLIMFSVACSMPGGEKAVAEIADGALSRGAQHPVVYDVRITNDVNDSKYPSLVWTGSEYGVAWEDTREGYQELYFTRIGPVGIKIGDDMKIGTNDEYSSLQPTLVWRGTEYGVSFEDYRDGWPQQVYFTRVSKLGSTMMSDKRASGEDSIYAHSPSLAAAGMEYGVVWEDVFEGTSEIYFARMSSTGQKIGSEKRLTVNYNTDSKSPSIAWNQAGYGVAWHDDREGTPEIFFTIIDSSGSKIIDDVMISEDDDNYSINPCLVWTGSEYGVAWEDSRELNKQIYFARIDSSGSKTRSTDTKISVSYEYSDQPSLVWNGSEYAVAWSDFKDGNREIFLARITSNGIKLGNDKRVTEDDNYSSYTPSLAASGMEYGVAWVDERNGNTEIYFARLNSDGTKIAQGGLTGTLNGPQSGYYYIRSARYGTYLTDYKYPQPGGLSLREYCSDMSAPLTQKWRFAESTGHPGWYKIISAMGRRIVGNPAENELNLQTSGGGPPVLWWIHDRENDGTYLLRSKVDNSYRIYADSESSVELSTNWRSAKMFEIIPAGY
jgi:hypothetical protein